jgi:hypothetical protein
MLSEMIHTQKEQLLYDSTYMRYLEPHVSRILETKTA